MPLYLYECPTCKATREELEKHSENITRFCVPCGTTMEKQISAGNFQFRGTGFYQTDYKNKGK